MAKLLAHSCETAVPIAQLRPEVPARVSAIVGKLMAKRSEERYQTPAELILDLAALSPTPVATASPAPPRAIPLEKPPINAPPPTVLLVSRTELVAPPLSAGASWQGRIWIAAVVIFSLLLLGLLVYLL